MEDQPRPDSMQAVWIWQTDFANPNRKMFVFYVPITDQHTNSVLDLTA